MWHGASMRSEKHARAQQSGAFHWRWLGLLLLVAVASFFVVAPGLVERHLNSRADIAHAPPSAAAQRLHDSLFIADLHADTLLWQRDLLDAATRGHVDLPRLMAGNVALQVFASVSQSPKNLNYERNRGDSDTLVALAVAQLQPPRTWVSPLQRSLWHAARLDAAVARSDALVKLENRDDVARLIEARQRGERAIGALLAIEGLHNLEGERGNLQRLFAAGYRMASPTHFFDNRLAGSMHGVDKGGLTAFGRQIVRDMQALGMVIDIAHLSDAAVADVFALATTPVVVSHGGVRALCDSNRNLSDDQIRAVAATGGVVGIGYWDAAVCDITPAGVVAAIRHVRDLVGAQHVALGSDFDGGTTVAFDTAELVLLTDALLDDGFAAGEIRAIMGGNVLRVLLQALPEAPPGT